MRDRLGLSVAIAVGGGINAHNASELISTGTDVLIMGTALFRSADIFRMVKEIKESVSNRLHR